MQGQLLSEGISIIFVLALTLAFVPVVDAKIADDVVISEVYPNPNISAKGEFCELYNPTKSSINLSGWRLEDNDSDSCTLNGTIPPYGFYLIVYNNTEYKKDNASWPNADEQKLPYHFLNNTGDELRLINSTGAIIDTVGYGDEAEWYEGSPAAVPGKGKSLQRKVNATINESASYGPAWDSNDNSADFFIQTYPNPQNSTWTGEHGPLPPVPELPSIVLLAFGLLMLAGYVLLTKRRR